MTWNEHVETLSGDIDVAHEKAKKYIAQNDPSSYLIHNLGHEIKHHKFKTHYYKVDGQQRSTVYDSSFVDGGGIDYNAHTEVEEERQKLAISVALNSKEEYKAWIKNGLEGLEVGVANFVKGCVPVEATAASTKNFIEKQGSGTHTYFYIKTMPAKWLCYWKGLKAFKNQVVKAFYYTYIREIGRYVPECVNEHIGQTKEKVTVSAMLLDWREFDGGYGKSLHLNWITHDGKKFTTTGKIDSAFNKEVYREYLQEIVRSHIANVETWFHVKESQLGSVKLPTDKFIVFEATVKEHCVYKKGNKEYNTTNLIRPKRMFSSNTDELY